MDVYVRPDSGLSATERTILLKLIESQIILFPQEELLALQDRVRLEIEKIQAQQGRVQNLSDDLYNAATFGRDGGLFVPRGFFESGIVNVASSGTVSQTFPIPEGIFTDAAYSASVELTSGADPAFSASVQTKSPESVTVHAVAGPAGAQFRVCCKA